MSDVLDTTNTTTETQPAVNEGLMNQIWGSDTPAAPAVAEPPKVDAPPATPAATVDTPPAAADEFDTVDEADYFKNTFKDFGWEDAEKAKAEITELRKLKDTPQFKYENDESRKLHELLQAGKIKEAYQILDKQERVEKLVTGEVSEANAEDIVKFSIKNKYKEFTDADVNRKFNKMFAPPKEPVQGASELDEDFAVRHSEWKDKVQELKDDLILEAKTLKPELEQLKTQLVLPDIPKENVAPQQKPPTQEELDAAARYNNSYAASVDSAMKDFSGFSVSVKNEDVDIPITYSVLDDEKTALSQSMKDFVKSDYDANALFAQRWVNADGTIDSKRMAEDRYLLENRDKILQKIASEAFGKAREAYIKGKKNININEVSGAQPDTMNKKSLQEQMFG